MLKLAKEASEILIAQNLKLVTAESCTGGLIAKTLTDLPGSSRFFERGFVTYSNDSKIELLGVQPQSLEQFGAVSEQVARVMALGALRNSHADLSLSVTGIAGPDGGSVEKPVGLVYIGFGVRDKDIEVYKTLFKGTRDDIRNQTMEFALNLIKERL